MPFFMRGAVVRRSQQQAASVSLRFESVLTRRLFSFDVPNGFAVDQDDVSQIGAAPCAMPGADEVIEPLASFPGDYFSGPFMVTFMNDDRPEAVIQAAITQAVRGALRERT